MATKLPPAPKAAPAAAAPAKPPVASHPSERWESAFVYAFVCKFAGLKGKVDGLDSPMDFEEALLSSGAHPVIEAILCKFILTLRPNSRNVDAARLPKHLAAVMDELSRSSERGVWWNETTRENVNPLAGTDGFFSLDWNLKLEILRQLVEWQLVHATHIRSLIDTAWGVKAAKHKKRQEGEDRVPPPSGDPNSMENLRMIPFGQDSKRKRYWVVDDSPRIYSSTNPWKTHCPFTAVSNTVEEFHKVVDELKAAAPPTADTPRRNKFDIAHLDLIKKLETEQFPKVEAELARIAKARKRQQQKNYLLAQAEVRVTRTRRQTRRPDYVYNDDADEEVDNEGDDYAYEPDEEEVYNVGRRRSTRAAAAANTRKRDSDAVNATEWRGERRSSRLGGAAETIAALDERPRKKSRMSSVSTSGFPEDEASGATPTPSVSEGGTSTAANGNGAAKKSLNGASKIKPTEIALDTVAGKKKSKFWYYAVEPIPGVAGAALAESAGDSSAGNGNGSRNGSRNGNGNGSASGKTGDRTSIPPEVSEGFNGLTAGSSEYTGSVNGNGNGNGNGYARGPVSSADRHYTPGTEAAESNSNMSVSEG
ncbi:hypothetical protein BOTBODRAFT_27751 [Botryobasidium botryosum FD-172 SS1]|uniref:WHIM1 domain-containing protein n=1 Tax=Botryobasidium botryosum (strain FD-172 SS1) TaxID=930990 RepID=A0A067N8B9_BOTB1|nr:hypothetical protein BOTBODRAFT_27751 [Botryobasidium botryosum FD-172 SS1]